MSDLVTPSSSSSPDPPSHRADSFSTDLVPAIQLSSSLQSFLWPVFFAILLAILSTFLAILGHSRPRYAPGMVVAEPIIARVQFRAIDQNQTAKLKADARDREPALYDQNAPYFDQVRQRLYALGRLSSTSPQTSIEQIPLETRQSLLITPQALEALALYSSSPASTSTSSATPTSSVTPSASPAPAANSPASSTPNVPVATPSVSADLSTNVAPSPAFADASSSPAPVPGSPTFPIVLASWDHVVTQIMAALLDIPLLTSEQAKIERDPAQRSPRIITKTLSNEEHDRHDDTLLSLDQDLGPVRQRLQTTFSSLGIPSALSPCLLAAILQNPQPTYVYNPEETRRRKQAAFDAQLPVQTSFSADELILRPGQILTDFDLQALHEEQNAYVHSLSFLHRILQYAALFTILTILASGLWAYIRAYNTRITIHPTRAFVLTCLLLGCQSIAILFSLWEPQFTLSAAAFATLLATIAIAIAYDQRFAMAVGAVQTLLISLSLQLSLAHMLILFIGAGIVSAQLDQVRTRSKLLFTGLYTGLAMAAITLASGLLTLPSSPPAPQLHALRFDTLLLLATGFLTGLFVQGILPAIEYLFKVTTALSLKELNDASHPLLRRLAQQAPGTYQHSLRLADLAEAAAQSISANTLLCKVGAMYHDIGKINQPDYFIENQLAGINRHNDLPPAMSLLVIVNHVRDGVEFAHAYKLPSSIRHLIESHHGTTLVEYFYHAAQRHAHATKTPVPSDLQYRYPGPKPQTREAAILMICDSIESASRTLPQPTPENLRHLVDTIVNKRLSDGQLDQAQITISQLRQIQHAITLTLSAMYHNRIAYPTASNTAAAVANATASNSSSTSASTQ